MRIRLNKSALIISFSLYSLSCLAPSTKNQKKPSSDIERTASSPSPSAEVDCVDAGLHEEFNLLAGEVYYDPQIKQILDAKCNNCHDNGTATDLRTYELAKNQGNELFVRVSKAPGDPGFMPQNLPALTPAQILLIKQWIDGNFLEKAPEASETPNPSASGSAAPSGSATPSSTPTASIPASSKCNAGPTKAEALEKALNPPELKECNAKGKAYDRKEKTCLETTALVEKAACDMKWVNDNFNRASDADIAKIAGFLDKKYTVDQCAIDGKISVVFFVKGDEKTLVIDSQKLLIENP